MTGLESLFRKYSKMSYGIAHSVLHSCEEAEDVVQDVFTHKVPKMMERYPVASEKEFGKMIAVAAKRTAIDVYRRRLKQVPLQEEWLETFAPVEDFDMKMALESLEKEDVQLITWKYIWNCTWAEVAEKLGVSESGARKKSNKVLQQLRGWFGGKS